MFQRRFHTCALLRNAVAASLALGTAFAGAGQQREWPTLPAPKRLESFSVGDRTQMNGIPVRIQGYVSDRSIGDINQWYRQKMGGQWVENKLGKKTVLGQRLGDFFITVELEAMLGGMSGSTTKVVTAIMDLQRPTTQPTRALDSFGDWATRLPVNSQVLSHLTDSSATHDSLHLVAVNDHSVALNAQHFRRQFGQLGYRQDTLAAPAVAQQTQRDSAPASQEKLSFTGPNTEAVVVLGRDDVGRSTVRKLSS
jgi:hypothetical protein